MGDIDDLLWEGRTLQNHLHSFKSRSSEDQSSYTVRVFTKLVFEGKIHSALRFLSDNHGAGVLNISDPACTEYTRTMLDVLRDKHPAASELHADALVTTTEKPPFTHPVLFECLTGSSIHSAALRTQGAAGPSGIDAAGWRRLCSSFHRESSDLCASIAAFARRLCTDFVDPVSLEAFFMPTHSAK